MAETFHRSSGNVFEDIGFTPAEAAELTAKSMLITAIAETIDKGQLTQKEAAHRCRTDQLTLSKVLRGRMESVTIDRLTVWLTALGRTVEIHVRLYDAKAKTGHLVAASAEDRRAHSHHGAPGVGVAGGRLPLPRLVRAGLRATARRSITVLK